MPQYARNKKAFFDFEILETFEAGLMLTGQEVKSIRKGGAKLVGAYITFHKNDAWLTNAHISKYRYAGSLEDYDPSQSRKILLNKKELLYLQGKSAEKGLTIVPLTVYSNGRTIKVELGVARGKKRHDKRESLKRKAVERDIARTLKNIT